MKKALLYIRVSDEMQEEKNSLAYQEKEVMEYCKYKKYEVYKKIAEVGSAWREGERKGFEELEYEIEKANFDILVLYSISRLARNQYVAHTIMHKLRMNEIEYEVVTEPFLNSNSPFSKQMFALLASQAEMESDLKSDVVRRRMLQKTREGYWLFQPPMGYDLKDNILYPNNEAEKVRNMYKDLISGYPINELCRKYSISNPGVRRVLTNVAYLGKTKFGFEGRDKKGKRVTNKPGEIFDGKHEAIIDEETFYIAQNVLKSIRNKHFSIVKHLERPSFILSGLLFHVSCLETAKMHGRSILRKNGSRYEYYLCCKRGCNFSILKNNIEPVVIDELKKYASGMNLGKKEDKKENFSSKIKQLEKKKENLIDAYTEGYLEREIFRKKMNEVESSLVMFRKENKKEEKKPVNLDKKLKKLLKNFDEKDCLEQRKILCLFIDKIVVHDKENVEIFFKF